MPQTDDLKRLIGKLKGKWYRKVRTLEGPAVLVVRTQMLAAPDPSRVAAIADDVAQVLSEELRGTARFSAVLVYEEPMWPPPTPAFVLTETHWLVLGSSDCRSYRVALLVPNPAARVRLTEDENDAFVCPRMLW